ncbi:MAG: WD40 repeat domain-containing protein [Gemmatales bacterium]|nr:WD40 repeat domain-containing protein [Gemmatales bacterium]MDW8387987.1 c-type cytochrome domain-containing protein [Gemmatales bacterium]
MFSAAIVLSLSVLLPGQLPQTQPDRETKAERALDVLRSHCYRCHGEKGSAKGGMGYILDRERLISSGKVIAGKPDASPLLQAIQEGRMPPPGSASRPDDEEIRILQTWIGEGAPSWASPTPRVWISQADVQEMILDDLMRMDRRARRFQRYFTLTHLHNAGASEEELGIYRQALAKLVNSLSWHPKITRPVPIDPAQTILRIDLRDFQWDANLWNRILSEYPYGLVPDSGTGRAVCIATSSRLPMVRADWFLATASRPPLYHDLLQLPTTAAELERQLRLDVAQNILQERVARAGFTDSGVSRNNRMIERHYAVHGAYWKTYDFEAVPQNLVERQNLLPDRRNLFAFPLGPGFAERTFQHVGGEIIFNLPNGLHGFMLVDALGNRIDKGPIAIVSDPNRPDRAVETGISCFSCHVSGILFKDDQIRDHVARNPAAFSATEAELVSSLYVPRETMRRLMTEDAERYRQAVEKTGAGVQNPEQINVCTRRYESSLDLRAAASEVDMQPEELAKLIRQSELLSRNLGGLAVPGGTVSREVFVQAFADAVHIAGKGRTVSLQSLNALTDNGSEIDPLEDASGLANAAAFTPDGRFVLFACSDKSIVVWDVLRHLEVRRLVGHTASVWAVAVSPDGREAASGSVDGTVRVWDLETGQERLQISGAGGPISCVAFLQRGRTIAAGTFDGKVVLWQRGDGRLLSRFDSRLPFVCGLAEDAPTGERLLLAGHKKLMGHVKKLPDKPTMSFESEQGVSTLGISTHGRLLVTGTENGVVRVHDLDADEGVWSWKNHRGAVTVARIDSEQGQVISASSDGSIVLRDIRSGAVLGKYEVPNESILSAHLTPDGRYLLAATASRKIHWLPVKTALGTGQKPRD